ncbi:hypothetical protein PBY51_011936 [Eleginops maclovinus]|uniref:Uncharacterized protein n=1 Tax=Eleginops maclovinus TaxID=56733 RepID=A0AAN7XUY2_ELEMC|nr:hypothetical protein PBY51_011936 [Eleginops maclovinus]
MVEICVFLIHARTEGGREAAAVCVSDEELGCYLLIPELPLEHRSGSVSRSAPCTGTEQPADRKARLASHKEANIEEHFLSQRGFVRRTRSNPPS